MKIKLQKQSKNNSIIIYLILCVIVLFALLISRTASKYVMKVEGNPIAQEATEFYFESELADVELKEYKNNYWNGEGTKNIEIDINNYLNNLLKANEDVKYKINVQIIDDTEDGINDTDLINVKLLNENNEVISATQELTLDATEFASEKYNLEITPKTVLESNKKFNIKISLTSIEPYEKTLLSKVEIIIDKQENSSSLIASENGEYVTLKLDLKNIDNDIIVKFDSAKLELDKSSSIVNNLTLTDENGMKKFVISKENLEKKIYEIYFIKLTEETLTLGTDIIIN